MSLDQDLEELLHNLQCRIERANQPNWEADWNDAPLPYKLYRGLPVVPLSSEVPLSLTGRRTPSEPNVETIGHFLWYVYGVTGVSQSEDSIEYGEEESFPIHSYRRFAPSGGALYPNELYLYLKLYDLPHGVYHYDAAHHRLELLREGNVDRYVERALGNRCDISSCFGTALISTRFWKNFFKYNNFSYRLQGLDAGVLTGQLIETAKRFGYESGVYGQFLDTALNHLLGLDEDEENVYSVIPLSVAATNWTGTRSGRAGVFSSEELCRELPAITSEHYERSEKIREFPMLLAVNEASKLEHTGDFKRLGTPLWAGCSGKEIPLPEVRSSSYDFTEACRNRYSPEMDFVMGKISQEQLSSLLKRVDHHFRNDLDEHIHDREPRVSIYGCFYNVEGIPDGAYAYDHVSHSLREISRGDYRLQLQSGLSLDNVNLLQVPLCLHIIGKKDYNKDTLGLRGYRLMQMEAGLLLQRLLLATSAAGFGGHPLLGFDTTLTDRIYQLDSEGNTTLIQIPIGPYRKRAWLRGDLLS
ncbi:SagB family peptide dehydrogenase [Rossellomorea aquimaris]|uniref:SagB family peptide dehydrogenase n=1 Tax=Rossellomorea aquimaris TaxID=189382 RepID=UPI001CD29267|nr:SagB family peptide dehydrogenase [Rossellomorea aquimaris]MCA1054174.1 SagB family peptide dehydrogenase [Rossellomorea aquimaris]